MIGFPKDGMKATDTFAAKHDFRFPLASDESGKLLEAFGAWVRKSMHGHTSIGIGRGTFLVDATGRVARLWRRVKVPGHAAEVMQAATGLGQNAALDQ